MRFLLLGGVGYLGGRLSRWLRAQGHEVHVTTRRPPEEVPRWMSADRILAWNWSGAAGLLPLLENIDVAIQLAGVDQHTAAENPAVAFHAAGALNWMLLEAASAAPSRPAVMYLSTFHVYGRTTGLITETTPPAPVHPYALAKRFGEEVVDLFRRERGVQALSIRLANAFGAPAGAEISQWSLAFNDFCRQAVERRSMVLHSAGTQRRNFITLEDAGRALEFLAGRPQRWPEDGILHVGSALSLSVREAAEKVAERACAVLGFRPPILAPPERGTAPQPFTFSTERLSALGFTCTSDLTAEIDGTLRLCAAAFGAG